MANDFWRPDSLSHLMFFAVKRANPAGPAKLKMKYALPNRPASIRKVLIVDDDPNHLVKLEAVVVRRIRGAIAFKIDPNGNLSIRQQVQHIVKDEIPDMVLMDGRLGRAGENRDLTGRQLIQEMRAENYRGYIVANSSDPVLNWEMTEQGADFSVIETFQSANKATNLATFLKKILSRPRR